MEQESNGIYGVACVYVHLRDGANGMARRGSRLRSYRGEHRRRDPRENGVPVDGYAAVPVWLGFDV